MRFMPYIDKHMLFGFFFRFKIAMGGALYLVAVGGVYQTRFNGFPENVKLEELIPMIAIRKLTTGKKDAYQKYREDLAGRLTPAQKKNIGESYTKSYLKQTHARL